MTLDTKVCFLLVMDRPDAGFAQKTSPLRLYCYPRAVRCVLDVGNHHCDRVLADEAHTRLERCRLRQRLWRFHLLDARVPAQLPLLVLYHAEPRRQRRTPSHPLRRLAAWHRECLAGTQLRARVADGVCPSRRHLLQLCALGRLAGTGLAGDSTLRHRQGRDHRGWSVHRRRRLRQLCRGAVQVDRRKPDGVYNRVGQVMWRADEIRENRCVEEKGNMHRTISRGQATTVEYLSTSVRTHYGLGSASNRSDYNRTTCVSCLPFRQVPVMASECHDVSRSARASGISGVPFFFFFSSFFFLSIDMVYAVLYTTSSI